MKFLNLVARIAFFGHGGASTTKFEWSSITPSHDLEYHDCHDGLKCARLILPLDWKDGTNLGGDKYNSNNTVIIAIAKAPAVVNVSDPAYGGTIITNPGGPGVSGVGQIVATGKQLRDGLNIAGKKHYDMLSFDPRGIANSEPHVDCFGTNHKGRYAQALESNAIGALDVSPAALALAVASAKKDSERCINANRHILPYIGTPNVARDILAIIDKIEESNTKETL